MTLNSINRQAEQDALMDIVRVVLKAVGSLESALGERDDV